MLKIKRGNVIPFVFKAITTERIDELEKENTTYKYVKGRSRVKPGYSTFFMPELQLNLLFTRISVQKSRERHIKTPDSVEVDKRVLSVGDEYENWISKAIEINGFEDDPEDLEPL